MSARSRVPRRALPRYRACWGSPPFEGRFEELLGAEVELVGEDRGGRRPQPLRPPAGHRVASASPAPELTLAADSATVSTRIDGMSAPGTAPPTPVNEPVRSYEPGSPERAELEARLQEMEKERIRIPLVIGGTDVSTDETFEAVMPHRKSHVLADVAKGGPEHVAQAIAAARAAHADWSRTPWNERAAVFQRREPRRAVAADAERGDDAEPVENGAPGRDRRGLRLIDFWRYNVDYLVRIYSEQLLLAHGHVEPHGVPGARGVRPRGEPVQLHVDRGNLSTSPALMGNTVVWKPASTAALSAYYLKAVPGRRAAGRGDQPRPWLGSHDWGRGAYASPELAGIHFTGSTGVFNGMWATVGTNAGSYRNYPRIVGETGGRTSSSPTPRPRRKWWRPRSSAARSSTRARKCSAASRLYIPSNLWPEVKERLVEDVSTIRMGDVADFGNFMGAVIDFRAFATHRDAIAEARSAGAEILMGGTTDDSEGYFVEPTVIATEDSGFRLLRDELFGPIVTTYVYDEKRWDDTPCLSTRPRRTGSPAPCSRTSARRSRRPRTRSATRLATST